MKKLLNSLVFATACVMFTLGLGGVAHAVSAVPELDPGAATSGVALLVGGALLLIDGSRRRHSSHFASWKHLSSSLQDYINEKVIQSYCACCGLRDVHTGHRWSGPRGSC